MLEVEEAIAAWFEARPYFYDISHEKYKKKGPKNAEVAEFAETLGMTRKFLIKIYC